jgi:formate dehydrogenase major subunit
VPSLGATFGRGAATTAQWDLANSDCVVIMGSNMAENHPIAFRFVLEAKERGATIIHVDPRFTRTSAMADIYAPVRAGTDIAFLGGLIHYILEHDLWFRDYALNYTNIAHVIDERYQDTEDLDGLFSGWDTEGRAYGTDSWQLAIQSASGRAENTEAESQQAESAGRHGQPRTDPSLQDPLCVYQILKRHYARYTPEMVERITGCPTATFLKIADAVTRNSGRDRTGAWCYAVGWTHHTTGVQTIRAAAIIQALLGNIGRPGGGILALRGHTSIQGSTDVPTLYNLLPGYLPQPATYRAHQSLDDYVRAETAPTGWWSNFPKYIVSLLRAWYGDRAARENGWGFSWLPKIVGDHSQSVMMLAIADGLIKGLLLIGQNPAVGGHNARLIRKSLANLEWMVVRETFENETANFWLKSPEVESGELIPAEVQTEVFLLPAALPGEKEGTFTNTHRLIQWHDKVVDPPGDTRSDLWFFYHLGVRLKELYAESTSPRDQAIQALTWDYPTEGVQAEPSADAVLKEINGYSWPEREQIGDLRDLKDDGSTACGVWIYTGVYPGAEENRARSRVADSADGPGSHLNWGYAWPSNRRVLYNRASADADGKPWSEKKRYVWWDHASGRWTGNDVPDFPASKSPSFVADWSAGPLSGLDAHNGDSPFIMTADGKAALFVPAGLRDGPLPSHYEPIESPIVNPLYPRQDNPAARRWERPDNRYHAVADPAYPYVITTYRLTEHHSGGIPTRFVPSTAELQPEGFAEIPTELANRLGIISLDWVIISTARGQIETRALVTDRLRSLQVDGRELFQIGLPWHFGWEGYATGDIANDLTALVGDPNTSIHEGKAFTCNLRKGRLRG